MDELKKQCENKGRVLPSWYKWVIIGLCFIMVMVCLGFCSSPYSWYTNTVLKHLDLESKADLYDLNKSIRFITTAVVNLFFGYLVTKFGTKKLILAGIISLIISQVCYGTANNLALIYVAGFFFGLGLAWTTTTIVGYVVNQWDKKNKGTIMGAVLASNGIGAVIATFTVKPIINDPAPFNYRTAYYTVAIILAVLFVLILLFYKDKKREDGLPAEKPGKKKARGQSWTGIEFNEVIRKPYFYVSLVCIFFTGMALQSITGIATPHLELSGLSTSRVDVTIVIHSSTLVVFKFLTGFMYDKIGLRKTTSICTITGVIVFVLLALVDNSVIGFIFALIYSIFSSLALPLETIMLPIYANDLFGEKPYSKTLGLIVSVNTAGYAVGAYLAGLCRKLSGGFYTPVLFIGSAMLAVVFILLQFVITSANKEKKRVAEQEKLSVEEAVIQDGDKVETVAN